MFFYFYFSFAYFIYFQNHFHNLTISQFQILNRLRLGYYFDLTGSSKETEHAYSSFFKYNFEIESQVVVAGNSKVN